MSAVPSAMRFSAWQQLQAILALLGQPLSLKCPMSPPSSLVPVDDDHCKDFLINTNHTCLDSGIEALAILTMITHFPTLTD